MHRHGVPARSQWLCEEHSVARPRTESEQRTLAAVGVVGEDAVEGERGPAVAWPLAVLSVSRRAAITCIPSSKEMIMTMHQEGGRPSWSPPSVDLVT